MIEATAFEPPEAALTVKIKHGAKWDSGFFLDEAVEFEEGKAELLRQISADCRFPRAAQSDQRDAPAPRSLIQTAELLDQQLPAAKQVARRKLPEDFHRVN